MRRSTRKTPRRHAPTAPLCALLSVRPGPAADRRVEPVHERKDRVCRPLVRRRLRRVLFHAAHVSAAAEPARARRRPAGDVPQPVQATQAQKTADVHAVDPPRAPRLAVTRWASTTVRVRSAFCGAVSTVLATAANTRRATWRSRTTVRVRSAVCNGTNTLFVATARGTRGRRRGSRVPP